MSVLAEQYRGFVFDLDGVIYRGPDPVEHAVSAVSALAGPVVYATNNASRTAADVAQQLRGLGLECTDRDVVTSAQAGAEVLRQQLPEGATVLAVGGPGVTAALSEAGFTVVTSAKEPVAAVLQGYGKLVTASDLAEAAYAIASGALWVATNDDATLPTERGIAPGNGTLVSAVRTATGVSPVLVGKPHAPLYALASRRLGLPPTDVLAVGDRLETDIAGAAQAGMASLLVLTGVTTAEQARAAEGDMRPRYVADDLRALSCPGIPWESWIAASGAASD